MVVSASRRSADLRVRPLRPGDDAAIGRLFDDTLSLGEPLPFVLTCAREYRELSIGWYLTTARDDAAVVVDAADPTEIVGYALVCTDEAQYGRTMKLPTLRFVLRALWMLVTLRMNAPSRRFYTDRARDVFALVDDHRIRPARAHAHLNVSAGKRSGSAALLLREHIDDRCRRAGLDAWSGDINARVGERRRALERLGLTVVSSRRNHTLSRRMGCEVERLMVVRSLAAGTSANIQHHISSGSPVAP